MNKNMERCLNFFAERYDGISSEKKLRKYLSLLPEQDQKIFEAKWGIDNSFYCSTFKLLNEKLKIQNSQELYNAVLQNLDSIMSRAQIRIIVKN